MPLMPDLENEVAVRPEQTPLANPGAFGRPGEALAAGAGQLSDEMAQFNARYMEARRSADAMNTVVGFAQKNNEIAHAASLIPDRAQALAQYNAQSAALQKQTLAGVSDPFARELVQRQIGSEFITRQYDVGQQSFVLESSRRAGDLDTNLATLANEYAAAKTPEAQALATDNATMAINAAAAGGWIPPEKASDLLLHWKSQRQEVAARAEMNAAYSTQDPNRMTALSARLADLSQFPGLDVDIRERLQSTVDVKAYRLEIRAASQQAHEDALAERNLHAVQSHNEASLLAGIYGGAQVDLAQVEHMADRQQISGPGLEAIVAAQNRVTAGTDDPLSAVRLWHAIDTGDASVNDVYGALKAHQLKGETATAMVRALDAKDGRGDNADAKAAFAILKTASSGSAIESGNYFGNDKSEAQARWAQAQGEWHTRVTVNGEDPDAVLSDMMPRYGAAVQKPTWLAAPQFGGVNGTKDLAAVWARTKAAYAAHQLTDSQYQAQATLLNNYRIFYSQEETAQAAKQAALARARKTANSGGAQNVGETPQ